MSVSELWEETGLTWCDLCGAPKEEAGEMRECPICGDNMCGDCASKHVEFCTEDPFDEEGGEP